MKAFYEISCMAVAVLALGFTSCIDEDLSDCPPDEPEGRTVAFEYQVQAETVSDAFDGTIRTLDVGFWNTPSSQTFADRISADEMPGNIYRVTLPMDEYRHLAVANHPTDDTMLDPASPFEEEMAASELRLKQTADGYIPHIDREIYAGYTSVDLTATEGDHVIPVKLYPCVSKLRIHVLYPEEYDNVRAYVDGAGCCYHPADDTHEHDNTLLLDLNGVATEISGTQTDFECFAFPTSGEKDTGTKANTGLPDTYYWKAIFRVEREGRTDQMTYYISDPDMDLREGQLTEVTFDLSKAETTTGVVIDLGWEPGGVYDPEV